MLMTNSALHLDGVKNYCTFTKYLIHFSWVYMWFIDDLRYKQCFHTQFRSAVESVNLVTIYNMVSI